MLLQPSGTGIVTREKDTGSTNTTEPRSSSTAGGAPALITFPFDKRVHTTTHRYGVDLKQNDG